MRPRTLVVAVAVIAVAGLVVVIVKPDILTLLGGGGGGLSSDEAPIYVKNGSLDIYSGDPTGNEHGKWVQESGGYSHDPLTGKPGKGTHLWVKVTASGGECSGGARFDGSTVHVDYSVPNVNVSFIRGNPENRTSIQTSATFNQTKDWSLEHPDSGGYIRGVKATGSTKSCTFGSGDNPTIVICEKVDAKGCQ